MKASQKFIAGAVCPQCNELDGLLLDSLDQSIECVDCGYQQTEAQRNSAQQDTGKTNLIVKELPKNINISNVISVTNIKNDIKK